MGFLTSVYSFGVITGCHLVTKKLLRYLFFSLCYSVSQPDTCVPMETVGDPHTVTVSMDSNEISMIINSIKEECFRSGVAEASGGSKPPSIDGKEDLDLAEKMDIAVSYTGEELDFETVGDIIAIIEDKVTIQQGPRESLMGPT